MTRRPILLVANPGAGGKVGSGPVFDADPARLEPNALAEALRAAGLDVQLHVVAESDDLRALARIAAADRDIVVAGGDGTVGRVASALLDVPDATLGILALGSFNNMARGFGVPLTRNDAIAVIAAGSSSQVDIGWVFPADGGEGRPFFEACGVGVDAVGFLAVEIASRGGLMRAFRALWLGLRRRRTRMRITLDGHRHLVSTPAVTVSNTPHHGPGMAVVAEADPTDGWLDVAIFSRMTSWQVLGHFLRVARRRPRREPRVRVLHARSVTIEPVRRALRAHADGQSIGLTPISVEIRPAALRIFARLDDRARSEERPQPEGDRPRPES